MSLVRGGFNQRFDCITKKNYLIQIAFFFKAGGSQDQALPPLDGVDVWNTISHGEPSPRKEILLNIDLRNTTKSDYLSIPTNDGTALRLTSKGEVLKRPVFQGIALRMGDMKLLMNVPYDTWYKPPELGGKSEKERGILQEEHGELDWFGTASKVKFILHISGKFRGEACPPTPSFIFWKKNPNMFSLKIYILS